MDTTGAELRRSEERYRAFLQNSSEGIWCCELDQPIAPDWPEDEQVRCMYDWAYLSDCNDAMARMYGYDNTAALIGARLRDLFVATDPQNEMFLRAFIGSAYQLRDAESHEQDKDGNDRFFLNSLVGVLENGSLVRAWGTQRDITERKKVETALRASEERFARFMAYLPGAAWIKNLAGEYVYANPEAERIFSTPIEALRGKTDHEVFSPATASQFAGNDARALQLGGIQAIETLSQADGVHESIVRKFPIRDEESTPVLIGGIAIDITEQRRAQAELAQSKERLDLATTAAKIGTFDWDIPTGRVVWNAQEEALFGLPLGTFEGVIDAWALRIHPEDLPMMQERIRNAMTQRDPAFSFAFRIVRADQAVRWIEGAARIEYAADGTAQRMVGVNMDMTERRESEAALQRANADLEQFAHAASHDLQEPLRMITLYTDLLKRRHNDALSEDAQHLLGIVRNSAARIGELVADLLSYTQAAAADRVTSEPVDANGVLQEVLHTLQASIGAVNAEISTDNLPRFRVHRTHLIQLLQNLLSNALKYHRSGCRPVIHVGTASSKHGMAELLVVDNGIGIPAEYRERIFGLFRRLHGPTVPGTGIGLAICKKIVERYNGSILVESTPGQGSTFRLTLPQA